MASDVPRGLLEVSYEKAAEDYLRSLPPEHFMEATTQSIQREITVESLALVKARRPEVQYFSELLVQYPQGRGRRIGQVVPDNMVLVHPEPIQAVGSYNLPLQPVKPFWTLEYVSKSTKRKDYEDNFRKYERELKVPYYLLFYPDTQDLTLYRHNGRKYVSVQPNENDRYPIEELDLEVALLDGWVRYWFQGKLLSLPADLQRALDAAERRADEEKRRADEEKRRADEEKRRADEEKRRADELQQRLAEAERQLAALRGRQERS